MRILERKLDYRDVLIVPQRSEQDSRSNVDLSRNFKGKWAKDNFTCVPIIASNMWNIGTKEMAISLKEFGILTALHKFYSLEELKEFLIIKDMKPFGYSRVCFLTIGQSEEDFLKLKELKEYVSTSSIFTLFINIDVANGYRNSFVRYVEKVRELCNRDWIMAGNVTTPEMTQELLLNGADVVKIGIGPGSVCETRRVTGIGYPMLSTIIECSNVAHGLQGFVCADGGCKEPQDICKAFCAGADFVMLGGMVAGTDECQGEWLYKDGQPKTYEFVNPEHRDRYPSEGCSFNYGYNIVTYNAHKDGEIFKDNKTHLKFFGMSSYEAMEKFGGKEKEYRASEGKCIEVPYKGPVSNVIKEICGGLRGCGSMIGANRIKDFNKCATFVQI